jgi:hypothetical protein
MENPMARTKKIEVIKSGFANGVLIVIGCAINGLA